MANLDAIVRELQRERDRLDAAIKALTTLGGSSSKNAHGAHVSRSPQADCCRTKGAMGEAEERLESSD
jgi:hypothetical protein